MRIKTLTALCVFLLTAWGAGCARRFRADVQVPGGANLRGVKRFAVMPFSDSRGLGEWYAAELARGLWALDRNIFTGDQLAGTLREMGVAPGDTMGSHDMLELRRLSLADAIISGTVDCPPRGDRKRVSVVIQDTAGGETVFSVSFNARRCGRRADIPAIIERVLSAIQRHLRPPGEKLIEEGPY